MHASSSYRHHKDSSALISYMKMSWAALNICYGVLNVCKELTGHLFTLLPLIHTYTTKITDLRFHKMGRMYSREYQEYVHFFWWGGVTDTYIPD